LSVATIFSLPSVPTTSHVQPLPNSPAAALLKASRNFATSRLALDGALQLAGRLTAALGAHAVPIERMVQVCAALWKIAVDIASLAVSTMISSGFRFSVFSPLSRRGEISVRRGDRFPRSTKIYQPGTGRAAQVAAFAGFEILPQAVTGEPFSHAIPVIRKIRNFRASGPYWL
jgi:hypothetical protein